MLILRRVQPDVLQAKVAELVDALDLGSSGVTRESSSLSFRTNAEVEIMLREEISIWSEACLECLID
jgi:hypothetical protein